VDEPQRRVDRVIGGDAGLGEVVREEAIAHERRPRAEDAARLVVAAGGQRQARERDHRVAAPVAEPRIAGDHGDALGGIVGARVRAVDQEPVGGEDEGRGAWIVRRPGQREQRGGTPGLLARDTIERGRGGEGGARAGLDAEDDRHDGARGEVGLHGDRRLETLAPGRAARDLLGMLDPRRPLVAGQAPAVDRDLQRRHTALGRPRDGGMALVVGQACRQRRGLGAVAAGVVVTPGEERHEVEADDRGGRRIGRVGSCPAEAGRVRPARHPCLEAELDALAGH
jgi:hypothetical protein